MIEVIPEDMQKIIGQHNAKLVLESIIANSIDIPNIYLLYGPDGVGKTSLSRIYAKLLNNSDAFPMYYKEINSNIINEDNINNLAEYETTFKYKIVSIEYAEQLTPALQAKLLQYIDTKPLDNVFIICTNDITKIISQLKNRAMEIRLSYIPDNLVKEYIKDLSLNYDKDIDDDLIDKIAIRCQGNLRTAQEIMYKYSILDKQVFNESILSCREYLLKFLIASFIQNKDEAEKAIRGILRSPALYIKEDYESLILEILKVKSKVIPQRDIFIKTLYQQLNNKILELFKILNDKYIYELFNSDKEIQTALWYIFIRIGELNK